MVKNNDFSNYSHEELGVYFLYGFGGEGRNYMEDFEKVKDEIRAYVKTKPEKFREDFKKSVYSELEAMFTEEGWEEPKLDDENRER